MKAMHSRYSLRMNQLLPNLYDRDRMDIELSTLEERAEAEEHLAEALRILNRAIRRVQKSGLLVQAEVLRLNSPEGMVPQLSLGTLDRQYGAI